VAGREVVFQCRDEGLLRAAVQWSRSGGLPLPPGSRDRNGRLEIPNVQLDATGTYHCEAIGYPKTTPGQNVSVYLKVEPGESFFFLVEPFLRGNHCAKWSQGTYIKMNIEQSK